MIDNENCGIGYMTLDLDSDYMDQITFDGMINAVDLDDLFTMFYSSIID